jgi:hypothetical protein
LGFVKIKCIHKLVPLNIWYFLGYIIYINITFIYIYIYRPNIQIRQMWLETRLDYITGAFFFLENYHGGHSAGLLPKWASPVKATAAAGWGSRPARRRCWGEKHQVWAGLGLLLGLLPSREEVLGHASIFYGANVWAAIFGPGKPRFAGSQKTAFPFLLFYQVITPASSLSCCFFV